MESLKVRQTITSPQAHHQSLGNSTNNKYDTGVERSPAIEPSTLTFSFSWDMAKSLITRNPPQLPSSESKQVIQSLKQASTNASQHPWAESFPGHCRTEGHSELGPLMIHRKEVVFHALEHSLKMVLTKNQWTPSFGHSQRLSGKEASFLLQVQFWGSLVEKTQPQNCSSLKSFLEAISFTAWAKEISAHDSLINIKWALQAMFITLTITCVVSWRGNSPHFVSSESQYHWS